MERLTIQRHGRGGQEVHNKMRLPLTACSKVPGVAGASQSLGNASTGMHSLPALHLCLCERDFKQ